MGVADLNCEIMKHGAHVGGEQIEIESMGHVVLRPDVEKWDATFP